MEFVMKTDLEQALPKVIDFNHEALKEELASRLQYYNGLVVTEDTIKAAKEDRATLNKLRTALDEKRKEVKRQCMVPYEAFEAKVKELMALIDEPVSAIDGQLKAFEETKKSEKQQEIREWYDANVADSLKSVIPLERIQKKDWLNATKDIKKIKLEIIEASATVAADLSVLGNMPEDEFTAAVKAKYMETLDITAALGYRETLRAAQDAFRARQAPTDPAVPVAAPTPHREPERAPIEAPARGEKLYTLCLEMHLTKAQADGLKKFLTDNNITYKKI